MRGGAIEPLSPEEIDAKFASNVAFGGSAEGTRLLDACKRIASMHGDYQLVAQLGAA
jgi:hypothetical protein